ncbi:MAG: bifunctional riboflavin kinase/FAD synthetase [Clostridia bacterium]|nr:bifunctional riboflavin kinase/FAD synthetase [Clostridia bacterium]
MTDHYVFALGFFDGVHLGHKALLKDARQVADKLGCKVAVLTFDTHPDEVIYGQRVGLINTRRDQKTLLLQNGADEVFYLRFDKTMMELSYRDFLSEILFGKYQPRHVVCGYDFHFGKGGEGTAERLKEACAGKNIGVSIIDAVRLNGEAVSSTKIRELLMQGSVEKANRLLGHEQLYSGTVEDGRKLGRTLGIPTANLRFEDGVLLPKLGVYSCRVCFDGKTYPAVCNIGSKPTVEGKGVNLEAHLLDYDGNLYGKEISVFLWRFLRPEEKFGSLEGLKEQILCDEANARKDFGEYDG